MKSPRHPMLNSPAFGAAALLALAAGSSLTGCASFWAPTASPAQRADAALTDHNERPAPASPSSGPAASAPWSRSGADPATGATAFLSSSRAASSPRSPAANDSMRLYGDTPAPRGDGAASPTDGTVVDGMESLSRVTFAAEGSDFDPCVSHDGKFIVFASTQHRATSDIYIKPVDGRAVTQLTADPANDAMPAISPDGQRIAFASNRAGSWDVFVMSAAGGQAVQLTADPAQELHPSWSPDGQRIVFCRLGEVSGQWELWVVNVAQPASGEFIGYGLFPSWCPVAGTGEGGRDKIAFQRSRERGDRAFSVWTVDYKPGDASSPTEIVCGSAGAFAAINPSWSSDGRRLVYATVPGPAGAASAQGRPAEADLWMTDVTGSGRVNLTAGKFTNLMPCWAANGRIFFVSDRGGSDNIWSIGTEKAVLAASGAAGPAPATAQTAHAPHAEPAHAAAAPAHEHEHPTAPEAEHGVATVPTP